MLFNRRTPSLPPRDFPLLLRSEWRIDNTPQAGRLRALAFPASSLPFRRPAPYRI
jgi:hypothetical protein